MVPTSVLPEVPQQLVVLIVQCIRLLPYGLKVNSVILGYKHLATLKVNSHRTGELTGHSKASGYNEADNGLD